MMISAMNIQSSNIDNAKRYGTFCLKDKPKPFINKILTKNTLFRHTCLIDINAYTFINISSVRVIIRV